MKFLKSSTKAKLEEERLARARLEADLAAARQRELEREIAARAEAQRKEQIQIYEQIQREKHFREEQIRQQKHFQELEEARRREQEWQRKELEGKRREKEADDLANNQRIKKLKKIRNASPETLRELRELIRARYQLDVEIWNLRGVRKPDQPLVMVKMQKADEILNEILQKVGVWTDNEDGHWTDEEWEKVQDIQRRLGSEGKRNWAANPPWADK
jgi:hypothetical protein